MARRRLGGRFAVALTAVILGLAATLVPSQAAADASTPPSIRVSTLDVAGPPEPGSTLPVRLDARLVRAVDARDAPAVLLAHGFGGTWQQSLPLARTLAEHGFAVVVWTARGFGDSGGQIHLDDPAYEGRDVSALVDALADQGVRTVDGDPVVAVAGVSYGAAVSIVAAATDPRIDAAVSIAGWADLGSAFFPNSVTAADTGTALVPPQRAAAGGADRLGPLKAQWLSTFFATVTGPDRIPTACGRMDPTLCRGFLTAAATGRADPAFAQRLHRDSPASLAARITVPVLVVAGVADSLFGLDQADLLVRSLTVSPSVAVRWIDGGHGTVPTGGDDSLVTDTDVAAVVDWLRAALAAAEGGALPAAGFSYPVPGLAGRPVTRWQLSGYPERSVATSLPLQASGPEWIATPPGGVPASLTGLALPGSTGTADAPGRVGLDPGAGTYPLAALPGQSTSFDTVPAPDGAVVVGAPVITLHLEAAQPGPLTLFVSVWRLPGPADAATLAAAGMPRPLLATVRVGDPGQRFSGDVAIALPASTYRVAPGAVWRVLVTTTNAAYANPTVAGYTNVTLGAGALALPTLPDATPTEPVTSGLVDAETVGLLVALGVAVALILAWVVVRRVRARALPHRPDLAELPLALEAVSKTYADGHHAVQDVSFQVAPGQVVGLLGPNGAGKTTTIRMLLGLIAPTAGVAYVLGEPVRPGAPVLRSVGALVEGPGFLPHLTGRQNLDAYWAATGRPAGEADLDTALEVAALGDAVDRPVRTYSQGMRQRLGIAQAMLGSPQLLILDEPTNGLDPPQIAAMRQILHDYAAAGRSVLVSSHLLGEVEQTCSHVVVMRAGRVLAAGAVEELLRDEDGRPHHLEEVFMATLAGDLDDGPTDATPSDGSTKLIERLRRIGR